jgi:Rhs element Vgr protein
MKVRVVVTIGELVLRNSELESLEVDQELGQHTTCRVEFTRDRSQTANLDELLKQPVTVTLQEDDGEPVEIFQGRIADGSQSHLLHFGARFVLHALSPSVRHEYRETVYFPESTLASIANKLGAKLAGTPRRDPGKFDYVQWGETELDFLRRLADEHGCFLVTTGPALEIRSEFQDKGWELVWGETLLELTARARSANHGITGASYDPAKKHTHRHHGVRQAPATLGGAARLVGAVTEIAKTYAGGGDPQFEEPYGRASTHADFKALLRLESERTIGGAVLVEAVSGRPGLLAGDLVNLVEGADFKLPTSGKLGLVKVVHEFRDQQYVNRFIATPWKHFTNLDRPARQVLPGPVTAEVVETATDPDKMGRVKIAYRWQADGGTSWARIVAPHAGNDRGMLFLPEIGDEVLVVFEQGDPERPLVVGALWNGKDRAPDAKDDNSIKTIRTRSGNTIQFRDDAQGESIDLFTPKGECMLQLLHPSSGDAILTLFSEGDIELQAKGEIRLKSKTFQQLVESDSKRKISGEESIETSRNLTLKAGMDLGLAAGMNAVLKGGINVESVAGAVNNVVGSLVHIQPPGFMGKQVQAKAVNIQAVDVGDRKPPEAAKPERTADAATPRTG